MVSEVIPSDAAGAASKDGNLKLDSHTCKNLQEFLRNHIGQSNHGSRDAHEKKKKKEKSIPTKEGSTMREDQKKFTYKNQKTRTIKIKQTNNKN